ncbi:peptidylprolyl isomerase [Thiospirochaeta perfilievii]|nr:peptidylprolyl isomerase [Thiospirochaeta perfilievii]
MKKLLLLLIPAVLFGCQTPENKVIASVSKHKITQAEFENEVERLKKAMVPEDYVMQEEEKAKFEAQILNNMILKFVYTQKLDALDIQVEEGAIDEQFSQLISQYGSEEAMISDVEAKGFTMDELREEFTYQYRMQELSKYAVESDTEVSDKEIETYYNDNKESVFAQPGTVTARHILVTTDNKSEEEALTKIKDIKEKISGGMDFSQAAVEYSEGPSGPNGGQLGSFQKGQMVGEFEVVAFSIPVNTVSEPVLTQFGYHLILVDNRTDKSFAPFEETKSYIKNRLKVDKFFQEIEDSAKIKKPDWAQQEV